MTAPELAPDSARDSLGGFDIEVEDPWSAMEECYARGWTDGLPVVPPSESLVRAMLAGGTWDGEEVLLHEPVRGRFITAHKAAANAVMAGCLPEFFPVVGAALQAMGDPSFNLHGPATSTGGAALMVIVNGPIRGSIGLHGGVNLFGPGVRANATIGRAIRLVMINCLNCQPGVLDKSTQGWAGKYSLCFAENEEASPWEPLHESRGVPVGRSAVTVFASESGHNLLDHGSSSAEQLLSTFADSMAALGSMSPGRSVVVICPEHLGHLRREGLSRYDVQAWLYQHARRRLSEIKSSGKVEAHPGPAAAAWLLGPEPSVQDIAGLDGAVTAADHERWVHRGLGPQDIVVCAGGGEAGGHSSFFPSWSRSRSAPFVTREVVVP